MASRGLGRVIIPDERDKLFPMGAVLPPAGTEARPYRYWWDRGWWGDQGNTPQCVGYAWSHWLEDGPITQEPKTPGADPIFHPKYIYDRAQRLDVWAGENYEGTSVRGGAKALVERGLISKYLWGYTLSDLINAVLFEGPVVVGTWWYDGMDEPDPDTAMVHVRGRRRGGHAYIINGVNLYTRLFRFKNSWGRSWGDKGRAWVSFDDMERLIHEDGEICLALEKVAA